MSRLTLVGALALLLCAGCDSWRLPGPPRQDSGAAVLPPLPAKSNRQAGRVADVDPETATRRIDDVRRGLRRLVMAEEAYFAENGVYTEDLTRIGFTPDGGSEVRFLWLGRDGWAASGTHPDLPGRDCVVFVGRAHGAPTTLRDVRPGREGTPICDAPPKRAAPSAVAPKPVEAAERAAGAAASDSGNALDAVDPGVQMRVDLRNLVRSQDTYYSTQGVYSRRTEPFALQFLWHKGVTISILTANDASWSARATHASRPGKSCVIWLGPVAQRPLTEAQKRAPEEPGTPVCDE